MQAYRYIFAIANFTEHQSHMLNRVKRGGVSMADSNAGGSWNFKCILTFNQPLALLAIGNNVGNRDNYQTMLSGKIHHLFAPLNRAIVINQFRNHPDRRFTGKTGNINGCLCVA